MLADAHVLVALAVEGVQWAGDAEHIGGEPGDLVVGEGGRGRVEHGSGCRLHAGGSLEPHRRCLEVVYHSRMAFSIKNEEADELLRELCERTGESLTGAVIVSLRERLERERLRTSSKRERIEAAVAAMRALPVIDEHADDVLQWDEIGLPV